MRESGCQHHTTHNPSGEDYWASRMRENRTYGSYGEGLETDRGSYSAPRQPLTLQGLFGRLEAALTSEVRTLGYPRAALFAFGTSVVAYNVLAVIQAAIAAAHDLEAEGLEVSTFYVADDVRTDYRGMTIAIIATTWAAFDRLSPATLARTLREIAANLDPRTVRKHPRGPKPKQAKGYAPRATVQRHVATAKVLRDGRIR
jgi:hypothetical protein